MLAGFREAQKRQDKVYQVITWFETDPSQQGHRDETMTQWLFFIIILLLFILECIGKQAAFTLRLPRQRLCRRRLKKKKKEREEM